MRGKYLVIEGIDGSGKGSALQLVADNLTSRGIKLEKVIEPGSGPGGQIFRAIIKGQSEEPLLQAVCQSKFSFKPNPRTQALLFSANRSELVDYINQRLHQGIWVLADRNYLSTLAYQGYGSGVPVAELEQLTQFAIGDFRPDLVIVLELPSEVARQRRDQRGTQDLIESQGEVFLDRVNQGYRALARSPHVNVVINASQTLEQVAQDIWSHVEPLVQGG